MEDHSRHSARAERHHNPAPRPDPVLERLREPIRKGLIQRHREAHIAIAESLGHGNSSITVIASVSLVAHFDLQCAEKYPENCPNSDKLLRMFKKYDLLFVNRRRLA